MLKHLHSILFWFQCCLCLEINNLLFEWIINESFQEQLNTKLESLKFDNVENVRNSFREIIFKGADCVLRIVSYFTYSYYLALWRHWSRLAIRIQFLVENAAWAECCSSCHFSWFSLFLNISHEVDCMTSSDGLFDLISHPLRLIVCIALWIFVVTWTAFTRVDWGYYRRHTS